MSVDYLSQDELRFFWFFALLVKSFWVVPWSLRQSESRGSQCIAVLLLLRRHSAWMDLAPEFWPGFSAGCGFHVHILFECASLWVRHWRVWTLSSVLQVFDSGSHPHVPRSGLRPGIYKQLTSVFSQTSLSPQPPCYFPVLRDPIWSPLVIWPYLPHSVTHFLHMELST